MRADNNWEDSLGKKLHDFEGELSPMAWAKIQHEIRPRRRRWLFWLPMVLLIVVPAGMYFSKFNYPETKQAGKQVAQTTKNPGKIKIAANDFVSGKNQPQPNNKNKPSDRSQNEGQNPETIHLTNPTETIAQQTGTGKTKTVPYTLPNQAVEDHVRNIEKPRNVNPTSTINKSITIAGILSISKDKTLPVKRNKSRFVFSDSERIAGNLNNPPTNITENALLNRSTEKSKETITKGKLETTSGSSKIALSDNYINNDFSTNSNPKTALNFRPAILALETIKSKVTPFSGSEKIDLFSSLNKSSDSVSEAHTFMAELLPDSSQKKEDEKKNDRKNLAWVVYGMPQFTYLRVAPNTTDNIQIKRLNNKNKLLEERIGYEVGVRVAYPLTSIVALDVGVNFSYINQFLLLSTASQMADSLVLTGLNHQVSGQVFNRETKVEHRLQYYFGGMYLGTKAALLSNLNFTGGIGANWLVHSKISPDHTAIPSVKLNPYLSAGLLVNFPISRSLKFQTGPTLQYYLRSVQSEEAYFGAKPTVFGFSMGLQLK